MRFVPRGICVRFSRDHSIMLRLPLVIPTLSTISPHPWTTRRAPPGHHRRPQLIESDTIRFAACDLAAHRGAECPEGSARCLRNRRPGPLHQGFPRDSATRDRLSSERSSFGPGCPGQAARRARERALIPVLSIARLCPCLHSRRSFVKHVIRYFLWPRPGYTRGTRKSLRLEAARRRRHPLSADP